MASKLTIVAVALSFSIWPVAAQTSQADARRFAEIQARRERGEPISTQDREWALRYRQQQRTGPAQYAEWAKANPARESTGLVPLPDLGKGEYQGFAGGLYPSGRNTPPAAHLAAGLRLARSVVPLDPGGRPSAEGKIALLSIGMSNTTMEFQAFQKAAARDPDLNTRLATVDGAQGGQAARITAQRDARFWTVVETRLRKAGLTALQVQAAWIKQANARPTEGFPGAAKKLQADLVATLHNLREKFPNLKIAYLSSRVYGGYALTPLNPEPYAYETGFAVKWIIADQIAGDPELNYDPEKGAVRVPWIAWGPYLWADGVKGRKDGLVWVRSDLTERDGTHPAESGRVKVARLLLEFLKRDPVARPWFTGR